MDTRFDRRSFLKKAGSTAIGASAVIQSWPALGNAPLEEYSFRSAWHENVERPWPGPEYWSNPLQDWRIRAGRLECVGSGGDRNVALLTRELASRSGDFTTSVQLGPIEGSAPQEGFAGFRIGSRQAMGDYRATAVYGLGLDCGIDAHGRLVVGTMDASAPTIDPRGGIQLTLRAVPAGPGYRLILRGENLSAGHSAEIAREVPREWLVGGLALVCSSTSPQANPVEPAPIRDFSFYPRNQHYSGDMRFWFKDWTLAGSKLDVHEERAYGPILFTLYTLSRGTLKLSAQLPPLDEPSRPALLQVRDGAQWKTVASEKPDPDAWNATFRVTGWDASKDHSYRVLYSMPDHSGQAREYEYTGKIRKDPAAKQDLTIGLLTCIWDLGFPHSDFTQHLAYHKPDILLWTGDQVYEPVGGFGAIESRAPGRTGPAMLDFQRKWFIFGWAVRDLTRDIPSVCMTDDHDMYHGNIWGCGGRPTNPALGTGSAHMGSVAYSNRNYAIQDSGGYKMAPRWVNMVQRLQTAHLPDPFEPNPVLQGISVYYCDLLWGGVSFAILEDRKWKSAPKPLLPPADIVNGFALNRQWNSEGESDDPEAELLGERQLEFLESWAADWSGGTWMKFAVSQTIFGCIHTEPAGIYTDNHDPEEFIPPPGTYLEGDHLVADYDSNAWPQHGRDAGISKFRKAFAVHLSGDQHLGSTSHYGVEQFRDGVYGVCTPAISSIWPRRWYPPTPGANARPGTRNTGDYLDAFGNRLTILAIANPARYSGPGLDGLRFRATGYTILTCNRAARTTTITVWPRWIDPASPDAQPYPGWPITVDQLDNGLWGAAWELNPLTTPDFQNPVVQVRSDPDGEVLYTVRIQGTSFTPRVRKPGRYTVVAFDPDGYFRREWSGLEARRKGAAADS